MSSFLFYSKNKHAHGIRSRSASPVHNRSVSDLNDPTDTNEGFVNPIRGPIIDENRISEECKSDEETIHSGSLQEMEDLLAPILSDSKKSENSMKSEIMKFKKQALSDNKKLNSNQNLLSSKIKKFDVGLNKTQSITLSSVPGYHLKSSSDDFGKPVPKQNPNQIGYFETKKLVEKGAANRLMSKKDMILQECMKNN